jgi:hypothetical protein
MNKLEEFLEFLRNELKSLDTDDYFTYQNSLYHVWEVQALIEGYIAKGEKIQENSDTTFVTFLIHQLHDLQDSHNGPKSLDTIPVKQVEEWLRAWIKTGIEMQDE